MTNNKKIRLIQVAKEFKVGLNTITDFLLKKGINCVHTNCINRKVGNGFFLSFYSTAVPKNTLSKNFDILCLLYIILFLLSRLLKS